MSSNFESRAKLACLYAGGVWGLFWIPLRALEREGINGLWVTVVYFLVPTIFLLPVGILRLKYLKLGGFNLAVDGNAIWGSINVICHLYCIY